MVEINENILITKKNLEGDEIYRCEVDRYGQFLFPKWILEIGLVGDPLYVYIEMIERLETLSIKNNWVDSDGKVYILYGNEEMEETLNKDKILLNSKNDIKQSINFLLGKKFILKKEAIDEENKYFFKAINL